MFSPQGALSVKQQWLQKHAESVRLEQQQLQQPAASSFKPGSASVLAGVGGLLAADANPTDAHLSSTRPAAGRSVLVSDLSPTDYVAQVQDYVEEFQDERALAAPMVAGIDAVREQQLLDQVDLRRHESRQSDRSGASAAKIQATVRMFLARTLYLRHQRRSRAEIGALIAYRNVRCAVMMQRMIRGHVARIHFTKEREEHAVKAVEAMRAKKRRKAAKKGGAGSGAAAAALLAAGGGSGQGAPTNGAQAVQAMRDVALQSNINFLQAVQKYLGQHYEDALHLLELQQKSKPEAITATFIVAVKRARDAQAQALAGVANAGAPASVSGGAASTKKKPGVVKNAPTRGGGEGKSGPTAAAASGRSGSTRQRRRGSSASASTMKR